jgi:hypothetical protein
MDRVYRLDKVPSASEYVIGLTKIQSRISELQLRLLREQYYAPNQTVAATELAEAVGVSHRSVVNSTYGKLGHLFCDATGLIPNKRNDESSRWWSAWSIGYETPERFLWEMHSEVAEALEQLGWVVAESLQIELSKQRQKIEAEGYFDAKNLEDTRQRVITAIVQRQGQSEFRRKLLNVYDRRCAITGCDAEPALEAAHIIPYQGATTNHAVNGLLLRADIHTLFDLHLLSIRPNTHQVVIAPELRSTCYQQFADQPLSLPLCVEAAPNQDALTQHYETFLKKQK